MDITKWKSCAVDIESYTLIRAMGKAGFRRPGSMIAKLVDEEVRKIAKKENKPYEKMKENLLSQGKKLLNGK
jgi:phage gp29-like protein|tara:strand:+ start:2860 stop:3075 length:216 start_codon:yes stop_codon:yes gene_type:complete